MPIRRLLIANRGEIALRVIRACRELGIAPVAVYSDADAGAPHVLAADSAVRLGPPPATESYLRVEALIEAARSSGADAVHPGYGFLSENAAFARACADAGLVFVGPSPEVIEQMGSKIGSRRKAQEAGLAIVPGETPDRQDAGGLAAAARRTGFPLLLKASAGGGGKGMRIVRGPAELDAAVDGAKHEAAAAFGDDTLYVERLLDRPRHVEIQVFGDSTGRVVSLFERDCSTQRRHQKVIEESPSPALGARLRREMGEAAAALARHIGYTGAGTVEFLVEGTGDGARAFFLEMNTRLQVEHPVTEAVTGLDLVHAQLLVASGRPLPWTDEAIAQRGHAIECRVYAEDPENGFLPQAGQLAVYREPGGPGLRVDSGVVQGGQVSVYYDPLLAKLVAWGETREMARRRAVEALRRYPVLGIRTNIPFLVRILESDPFRTGTIDTGFLDREPDSFRSIADSSSLLAAAVATAMHARALSQAPPPTSPVSSREGRVRPDPWVTLRGWRARP